MQASARVRDPGLRRARRPGPVPPDRTMRTAPLAALLLPLLLLALLAAPAVRASRADSVAAPQPGPESQPRPPPGPEPGNATRTGSGEAAGGGGSYNSSGDALVTRISSLLRDLPTLKAAVIVACAFTALLIACLLLRVFRWVRSSFATSAGQRTPPTCGLSARCTCAHRCSGLRAWVLSSQPGVPGLAPQGCARLVFSATHFRNFLPFGRYICIINTEFLLTLL